MSPSKDQETAIHADGELSVEMVYDLYPEAPSFPNALSEFVTQPLGSPTQVRARDPNGIQDYSASYAYDQAGRVVVRKVTLGDRDFVESYAHTLDGVAVRSRTPFGAETIYRLGPSMLLIGASVRLPWQGPEEDPEHIIEEVTYHPKGMLQTLLYRAGARTDIDYDPGTLIMRSVKSSYQRDGAPVMLQDLELDVNMNRSVNRITDQLRVSEHGHVDRSSEYRYSPRNELIAASKFGREFVYEYGPTGNFVRNTEFSEQSFRTLAVAGTGLLPLGTEQRPYSYNALGQLARGDDILETRFDAFERLIYVRTSESKTYFGYNHTGRRIYKQVQTVGGQTKLSLFPLNSTFVEPIGGQTFVYLGEQRLARIEHEKRSWFYYLKDHLLSSDIMMSADGLPVEQMLYMPYGGELDPEELSPAWAIHVENNRTIMPLERTHHRFTGEYLDDDTGLYYLGSRYYAPAIGRFVSADFAFIMEPERCVANPISCGLYAYANNNPMTYVDPTGENGCDPSQLSCPDIDDEMDWAEDPDEQEMTVMDEPEESGGGVGSDAPEWDPMATAAEGFTFADAALTFGLLDEAADLASIPGELVRATTTATATGLTVVSTVFNVYSAGRAAEQFAQTDDPVESYQYVWDYTANAMGAMGGASALAAGAATPVSVGLGGFAAGYTLGQTMDAAAAQYDINRGVPEYRVGFSGASAEGLYQADRAIMRAVGGEGTPPFGLWLPSLWTISVRSTGTATA